MNSSEDILATGQYYLNPTDHTAEVALAVKDEHQATGHRHGTTFLLELYRHA